MWSLTLGALIVIGLVFVFALCKASGEADDRMEAFMADRKETEGRN